MNTWKIHIISKSQIALLISATYYEQYKNDFVSSVLLEYSPLAAYIFYNSLHD